MTNPSAAAPASAPAAVIAAPGAYALWASAVLDLTWTAQSVVTSRMMMFAGAPFAKRGRIESESRRMVVEKMAAAFGAQAAVATEAVRLGADIAVGRATIERVTEAPLHFATAAMAPLAVKARANRRRFSR